MHKRFMFLLAALVFAATNFSSTTVHAEDSNDYLKKVYFIRVYEKSSRLDTYLPVYLGSAIALENNKLVTNAHVIMDDDNQKPYKYIEICETFSPKKAPRCIDTATVIAFDEDKDIAILQTQNTKNLNISKLSTKEPKTRQKVSVIGYPSNGGTTITTTQGIIAGFEDDHYKIDANIDHGNSGGGTYDDNGEVLGIPVFYIDGGTALGYMIPADIVNTFFTNNKTKKADTIDKEFIRFTKNSQKTIQNQIISNNMITLDLKGSNFELIRASVNPDNTISNYTLKYKDSKAYASITISASDNNTDDIAGRKVVEEKLKDIGRTISYSTGQNKQGLYSQLLTTQNDEDGYVSTINYELVPNKNTKNKIHFGLSNTSKTNTANKEFKKLFEKLKINSTKEIAPRTTIGTISLPTLTDKIHKMYEISTIGDEKITFDVIGLNISSLFDLTKISKKSLKELGKKSLQSFADDVKESIKSDYELIVTTDGLVQSTDKKSQRYVIIGENKDHTTSYIHAYSFVTNPKTKDVYILSISFTEESKYFSKTAQNTALEYLSRITLNSTIPYQIDSINWKSFDILKQ